jgi:hypothetical protein
VFSPGLLDHRLAGVSPAGTFTEDEAGRVIGVLAQATGEQLIGHLRDLPAVARARAVRWLLAARVDIHSRVLWAGDSAPQALDVLEEALTWACRAAAAQVRDARDLRLLTAVPDEGKVTALRQALGAPAQDAPPDDTPAEDAPAGAPAGDAWASAAGVEPEEEWRSFEGSFKQVLRRAYNDARYDYWQECVSEKGPEDRLRLGLHSMEHIGEIARWAKQQVDGLFGRFATSAPLIPAGPGEPGNIRDQFAEADALIAAMDEPARRQAAARQLRAWLHDPNTVARVLAGYGVQPVFSAGGDPHNDDAHAVAEVIEDILRDPVRVGQVLDIWRGWPAEMSFVTHEVWIQTLREPDARGNQFFLWRLAQTLVHEYIHLLEHPDYGAYLPAVGSAAGDTLREGVPSFLQDMVWLGVAPRVRDPGLRRLIEGEYASEPPLAPDEMPSIVAEQRYPSYAEVMKLLHVTGSPLSLYAAFFLGDVEKITGPVRPALTGPPAPGAADLDLNFGPSAETLHLVRWDNEWREVDPLGKPFEILRGEEPGAFLRVKAGADDPGVPGGELMVPLSDVASWGEWLLLSRPERGKAVYVDTSELSQRDLFNLMYVIVKEDRNALLGGKVREYSVRVDLEERRSPGSGDRVVWTGEEVVFHGEGLQRRLDRLVAALEVGRPAGEVRALAGQVTEVAGWVEAALSGFVRDTAGLGGMYRLRNRFAPLVAAARNLAAAAEWPGGAGLARGDGLKPVSPQTLRGLAAAVRQFRHRAAYEPVSTGEFWVMNNPGVADLTREERISFIEDLSARNLASLRERTAGLLSHPGFRALYDRIMSLPLRLKHATGTYHSIARDGVLSSIKDLTRAGNAIFGSGYTTGADIDRLRNDDFVFFRVEAGDWPVQTRFGSTVITLDFQDIGRLGGWISLHEQLNPLAPDPMASLVHNGRVIRTGDDHDFNYGGSWEFFYHGEGGEVSDRRRVDLQDEVFFGGDSLEGLALSVLEEADRIGGELREEIIGTEDPDDLWYMITRMFRPEAKIPSGPLMNIGEEDLSDGFLPVSVENPDGAGLYLPDGTIDTDPAENYLPPSRPYPAGPPLAESRWSPAP